MKLLLLAALCAVLVSSSSVLGEPIFSKDYPGIAPDGSMRVPRDRSSFYAPVPSLNLNDGAHERREETWEDEGRLIHPFYRFDNRFDNKPIIYTI
jgi:hypothetical protein